MIKEHSRDIASKILSLGLFSRESRIDIRCEHCELIFLLLFLFLSLARSLTCSCPCTAPCRTPSLPRAPCSCDKLSPAARIGRRSCDKRRSAEMWRPSSGSARHESYWHNNSASTYFTSNIAVYECKCFFCCCSCLEIIV